MDDYAVDYDDADDDSYESEGSGGLSGPKDKLRGRELDESIMKDSGKSHKLDLKDIQQAVADQKARRGHPNPFESGYGPTGPHDAQLEKFHAHAKANGTTLPKAVHDYAAVETVHRFDPSLGAYVTHRALGHDPYQVLQDQMAKYADPAWRKGAEEQYTAYEVTKVINNWENHPDARIRRIMNDHHDARPWMAAYITNGYANDCGNNFDKAMIKALRAYEQARVNHKATMRANERQNAIEEAKRAERQFYGRHKNVIQGPWR